MATQTLNTATPNSPPPAPYNGSVYKWIAGGLAALLVVLVAAWAGDISTLKERTSTLEANTANVSKQVDDIRKDIDKLESKLDGRLSEVLNEIRRTHEGGSR